MEELWKDIIAFDISKLFIEPTKNTFIQLFRYLFVGGTAFAVDAGCLFLLELTGIYYLLAAVFAFTAGLAVNFLLSKALVFKGSESGNSNEVEFLLYAVIGVIGLGLTEMIMYLFTEKLSLYFMVSKVIAAVAVLIWNFAARKITLYRK